MKIILVQPTYNERENITQLVKIVGGIIPQIEKMGHTFVQLIVDDYSPDGTGDAVLQLKKKHSYLHLLTGKKQGLGNAYARGMRYAMKELKGDIVIQMDADLQHDPRALPDMIAKIEQGCDVVIGSRYINGGSLPAEWGRFRRINSQVANLLARYIAGISQIHDCTSGYRVIRVAGILDRVNFDHILASGYSFQLMLLASLINKKAKIYEYPIAFAERLAGVSKVGANATYFHDIVEFFRNAFIIRFYNSRLLAKFVAVGAIGVVINLIVFRLLSFFSTAYFWNELVAGEMAIVTNFYLNHTWTFKHRAGDWKHSLWRYHLSAFLSVLLSSAIVGGLSTVIDPAPHLWYVLVGVGVGAAWNYLVSSRLIWRDADAQSEKAEIIGLLKKNPEYLLLTVVIVLSLVANLLYVNNFTWFSGDEGRDMLLAAHMAETWHPILQGSPTNIHTTIGNFFFSPLYWYMLVPAYLLTGGNPAAGVYMQVGLFLLTLPLLYFAIKILVNKSVAVVMLTIYPLSNYVVWAVNRRPWNPNSTPSIMIVLLFSIAMLYRKQQKYLWLFAISLSILWQLDYAGALVIPVALGILVYFARQRFISLATYIQSLALFCLMSSPLMINELRYNFPNLRVLIFYVLHTPKPHHSFLSVLSTWYQIAENFLSQQLFLPKTLAIMVSVVVLLVVSYRAWVNKQTGLLLSLLLCVVPIFLIIIYPGELTEHYFLIGLLAPYLLISWVAVALWRSKAVFQPVAIGLVGLLIMINLQQMHYLSPSVYKSESESGQLNYYLTVAQAIKQHYPQPLSIEYAGSLASYPDGMQYILKYKGVVSDSSAPRKIIIGDKGVAWAETLASDGRTWVPTALK